MKILPQTHVSFFFFSSSVSVLSFPLFLVLCFHGHGGAAAFMPENETVPALLVFGDSIVDPGNNNNINTPAKCNFPPYGKDFMGGKPTGRFSNGKIPTDFFVEAFGIKELLPAYLDPTLQPQDLLTGVSFASGGSGYDPLTSKLASVFSLTDQLQLFRGYLVKINSTFGEDKAATILSKGIFIVCLGTDDIANTYFLTPIRKLQYDIDSYTDFMIDSASSFFQELYGAGARKIGVVSLPPIGCVPAQRTLAGGLRRDCVKSANDAATLFNSKLSAKLDSLTSVLPDSKLVYIDIFNPVIAIIKNPAEYGFEEADKGCCGTGKLEVSITCTSLSDASSCKDASKYFFWDSYHPSEKGYQVLSSYIMNRYTNRFF